MRLLVTALLFCLALQAPLTLAKEEPLYLIEMVFFLHTDEDNKQAENWPKNISLGLKTPQGFLVNDNRESIYPNILDEKADKDDSAYPIIYRYRKGQEAEPIFPEGIELVLRDKAKKINSVGRYQFIEHIAFAQRIDARFKDKANNIVINIEDTTRKTEQAFTIAGSFTLHKNRFLHLNTDLWISYFNPVKNTEHQDITEEPMEAESMEALLASPEEVSLSETDETLIEDSWPLIPEIPQFNSKKDVDTYIKEQLNVAKRPKPLITTEESTEVLDQNIELISKMSQARKMRSKETHYIDHPLFGVVIEIREFPKPEVILDKMKGSVP